MAEKKCAADVSIRITEALEVAWVKFCEVTKELIKSFFVFLCIVVPVAVIVVGVLIGLSNSAFAPTESRLAQQLSVIADISKARIGDDQRESLMRQLIESYDSETDNMNPVLNPNVKPVDLQSILSHFEISEDGVKMLTNPNGNSKTKGWE